MGFESAATGALLIVLATGCTSVKMESQLPSQSLDSPSVAGTSRVIFYNDTTHGTFPASKRVGIQVDGKGVAAIYAGQYVRVDLPAGRHHLDLSHVDTFEMHDEYSFLVGEGDLYVRVYCAPLSTMFEVAREQPADFQRFKAVKQAAR